MFGGQITTSIRANERDRGYQDVPEDIPVPTYNTLTTAFPVPDPSPSTQRMYDKNKRNPLMTSQIGWRATYWPISLSYIAEIQTDEFWTIYVRKYGGDVAKVYPKIRRSWKSATASGEIRDGADLLPEVERNFTDLRPRYHIDHLTDKYKWRRFLSAQTTANQVKQTEASRGKCQHHIYE